MVKDPRPPKPGSPEPDDALDLLRALARSQGASTRPSARPSSPPRLPPEEGEEKLDALKALAHKLDMQLRAPAEIAPQNPDDHPLAVPTDTPFGSPVVMPDAPRRPAARDSDDPRRRSGTPAAASRLGPQRIIFIMLALAVLAAAAADGVMRHRFARPGDQASAPASSPTTAPQISSPSGPRITPPAQIVPPTDAVPPTDQATPQPQPGAPPDLAAITKSMSECDTAAAQEPDALYFLILPLIAANPTDQSWRSLALQTVGSDILLLSAKDALEGLRDKKLNVRAGRYTFAVLDTTSGATFSWTSATSLARLSKSKVGSVKSLRLGFDFSAAQAGPQWSADFKRDVGACYWVSVLIRQ